MLPERPDARRAVSRLAERVRAEGGHVRVVAMVITDPRAESDLVDEFTAERADEYAELLPKTEAFLKELRTERAKGRVTYGEVEENEADLERLKKWLAAIEGRDYFDTPGRADAKDAIELCQRELEAFENEAMELEQPAREAPRSPRRNLRSVKDTR
jgi:hypothetical protein